MARSDGLARGRGRLYGIDWPFTAAPKPPPGSTIDKSPCAGKPFDLKAELKSENENGIQADFVCLKFFVSKV